MWQEMVRDCLKGQVRTRDPRLGNPPSQRSATGLSAELAVPWKVQAQSRDIGDLHKLLRVAGSVLLSHQ
jgi:hypothetical protein